MKPFFLALSIVMLACIIGAKSIAQNNLFGLRDLPNSASSLWSLTGQTNNAKKITVDGTNANGTDTGISVSPKDKIKFTTVTGTFRFNADKPGRAMTFQGADEIKDRRTYAFPNAAPYSLVGWIGNNRNAAFQISKLPAQTYTATSGGKLFLAINDETNRYTDNIGGYVVTIELTGGSQPSVPSPANTAQTSGGQSSFLSAATRFPIPVGSALKKGVKYPSPSGNHYLILQNDGNMIIKTKSDGYVWGLDQLKKNSADRVELGRDGGLVAYDAKGKNIWSPQAKRDPNAKLDLTFNGALQLVAGNGEVLWSSDEILAPSLKVFIDKPTTKACTAEPGWAKCLELPSPAMKIFASKAVSQSALNGVANVYTEMTKRFQAAKYPLNKLDGYKVYITNGEPWSVLSKMNPVGTMWPDQTGPMSGNFLRGGSGGEYLWIEEQMICKQGVKTRNADGTPDNELRTLDQVVHEFAHTIDTKYIPDPTVNLFAPLSSSGVEGFARGVQGWFGAPRATFTPAQEAVLKGLFTSRATFSCEGYRP